MPRATWLSKRPQPPSLTATQVALQFASRIQAGERPSIEAALDQAPKDEWATLLQSLLIAEINARRARGENPTARDYLPRFPAHTDVVRTVAPDSPPTVTYPDSPAVAVAPATTVEQVVSPAALVAARPHRRSRLIMTGGLAVAGVTLALVLHARSPRPKPVEAPLSSHSPPPAAAAATVVPNVSAAATDPERDMAEWVLRIGGRGTALPVGGSRRPFSPEAPLPKNRFAVTSIVLPPDAADRWKPDDLRRLRGRDKISAIELHTTRAFDVAALSPLAGLPLRTLDLDVPVRASGTYFASFPELESLSLRLCPDFSDADLAAIGGLGKLSALRINSPKLTANGFKQLQNPGLKTLTLGDDVPITPDVVRVLQRLPLEVFDCASEVTDDAFVEFALFPELGQLRVHRAAITDSSLRAVVGLGNLEEFRAVGSSVTETGLVHIAERTGLKVLDLSGGKLSNDALGPLLGMPALKELRLAGNPITDDGVVLLAQVDGIEILDLGETGVTDAALAMLKKHSTLKTLIVTNTRVTEPGVREFETATPGCKVVFGKRR